MKILIFSSSYGMSGSSIRASLIAKGLHALGNSVAVSGYNFIDKFSPGIETFQFKDDKPGWEYLLSAANTFKPDWLLGITEDEAGWIIHVCDQLKCRAAFDLHGIALFEIIDLGRSYGNKSRRIKKSINNLYNISKAQLIISATPMLFKWVSKLLGKSKVINVSGMVDLSQFSDARWDSQTKNKDKFQVFYIGNYYKWQGINLFLDAARAVYKQSSRFVFSILGSVGKQQENDLFNNPLIKSGKVKVIDTVPHDEVPRFLDVADILVIPRPWMLSTYFGFPSKICEYMASGKLVIATDIAPHKWALRNPDSGILCPATPTGLAEAILSYEYEKARYFGEIARESAMTKFDYIKQCKKIQNGFLSRN